MELMSPPIASPATLQATAFASALRAPNQQATTNLVRATFLQAAQNSREHVKQTGLHITFDEFSTWVDAVQTNPQAQMPQCHV
jgi:hypothetical protein